MQRSRVALALLSLVALLPILGGETVAQAQTGEDVQQADQARKEAYSLVGQATTNREAVEVSLFEALNAYQAASERLAEANSRLARLESRVVRAEAEVTGLSGTLDTTVTNAYMKALGGEELSAWHHDDIDGFLVATELFRSFFGDTDQQINRMLTMLSDLDRLWVELETERTQVATLVDDLEAASHELELLLAEADAELAAANTLARQAEIEYRNAVSAAEAAKAAREAEARRKPEAGGGGSSGGSIKVKPAVEAWRPVVQAHFPAHLVEDALKIMQCESGGNPNAVNPYSGASGLYQFLPTTWAVASVKAGVGDRSVFDGEANIIAAAWLAGYYESRGYSPWQPWACRFYL